MAPHDELGIADLWREVNILNNDVVELKEDILKLNETFSEALKLLHETVKRVKALELNFSVF